jgi:TonB family protein
LAQVRISVAVQPQAGEVRSQAQRLGGGPSRLDNPGGRHVGNLVVQFTVQADGRVSNCQAVRSSGKAGLDAMTCRLVEQRMRFKPALDAQGNPVASTAHAQYEWGRRRRHPNLFSWVFR